MSVCENPNDVVVPRIVHRALLRAGGPIVAVDVCAYVAPNDQVRPAVSEHDVAGAEASDGSGKITQERAGRREFLYILRASAQPDVDVPSAIDRDAARTIPAVAWRQRYD